MLDLIVLDCILELSFCLILHHCLRLSALDQYQTLSDAIKLILEHDDALKVDLSLAEKTLVSNFSVIFVSGLKNQVLAFGIGLKTDLNVEIKSDLIFKTK